MSKPTVHNSDGTLHLGGGSAVTIIFAMVVALAVAVALPVTSRAQETAAPSAAPTADMAANDDAPDAPPPPAIETPAPLLTPVPAASAAPLVAPSLAPRPSAGPASVSPASVNPAPASPARADVEPPASVAPSVASDAASTPLAAPGVITGSPSAAAGASPVAAGSPLVVAGASPTAASPNGNGGKVINPTSGLSALFGGGSPAAGSANGGGSGSGKAAEPPSATSLAFSFLALLGFCALGLVLMRRRLGFSVPGIKGQRKLVVSETRALGNRQFLLVVEYENQRVLLGVTPGKIDYLCELTPPVSAGPTEAGATPATEKDYGALIDQAKARQTP